MPTKTTKPLVKVNETTRRKVARYARLNRILAIIEERKKMLASDIISAAGGKECIVMADVSGTEQKIATLSECTRETVDGKALKETHPAIFAEFARTTEYVMLRTA